MGDLIPFDFFRQETSHADVVIRTDAMKRVAVICGLMGPDKARSDMLPYLATRITDMDQVLLALSKRLADILPFIGGPEHASYIVALVESLCNIEDVTVRSAAAISSSNIVSQLQQGIHAASIEAFYEAVQRLSSDEAGEVFYGRVSSCAIIPSLYSALAPSEKAGLREIFDKLVTDELPMVKRAAGKVFLALAKVTEPEIVHAEFTSMMKLGFADEHPTVKEIYCENLGPFLQLLVSLNAPPTAVAQLLSTAKASLEDSSWRIRLVVAKNFGMFAAAFQASEITSDLFPAIINLIQDLEPDVRTLALPQIVEFVPAVGPSLFISLFSPVLSQLVEDPTPNYRKALADVCIDIIAKVGPEATAQHLSEVIIKLIKDEDPMVRLRVIKKIHVIASDSHSLCMRLTDQLSECFRDPNWRVRKQIALAMPAIVKFTGSDHFTEHFLTDYVMLLKDGVEEVRAGCAHSVPQMVEAFNAAWVQESVFPAVKAMATGAYLVRCTMLSALQGLLQLDLPSKFQTDALTLIISATSDKVPNIRLRAVQVLGEITGKLGVELSVSRVRPVLMDLANDKDNDVKYFAQRSLVVCP